jgi:hypothetical protein
MRTEHYIPDKYDYYSQFSKAFRGAEQEQSLTRYATIVGIVTGLFGMLLGVGLVLLPSATTREKVLVIAACLAVSVAGLTGGAWRGFIVSGKTGTGNFYAIHSVSVRAGHPTELNLPIRPGTEELQLVTTLSAGCLHSAMVWGNARLTG